MPTKDELFDRAVDHVADGDLAAAVAAYEEALALDPAFADAWQGLALAASQLGRHERAIEAAKKLVELAPEETLAHTTLSRVYQAAGMIPEAEAVAAKARILDWKRQLKEGGS
ncbi:MAG TPA: tetratricopeptide repeat protein [Alphaproteobacteria bacterium]|jgi:restriction system protein|nr:tetratricopeptide repeat protein [Alphaproteobacteria bacterium]